MAYRKKFTEDYKREAVQLANDYENCARAAKELGISSSNLQRWIVQSVEHPDNPFPGNGNPFDPEKAQLQRDVARLKEENEILKKAVGIFTSRSR